MSARLIEISEALLAHKGKYAYDILGDIDDMKIKPPTDFRLSEAIFGLFIRASDRIGVGWEWHLGVPRTEIFIGMLSVKDWLYCL